MNGVRIVLFDLDGTLVDSSGTIDTAIRFALEQMAVRPEPGFRVEQVIGRPLLDIFRDRFAMEEPQARKAIDIYREHYDSLGRQGTRVYPGIEGVLQDLRNSGRDLYVATVKPTSIAERVLDLMGLRPFFTGVAGASMGPERRAKHAVIAHALQRFDLDPTSAVMVGDRNEDINGARRNGLDAVGVTYGFGSREELESAGASHVVDKPRQIPGLLLS